MKKKNTFLSYFIESIHLLLLRSVKKTAEFLAFYLVATTTAILSINLSFYDKTLSANQNPDRNSFFNRNHLSNA